MAMSIASEVLDASPYSAMILASSDSLGGDSLEVSVVV